MLWKKGLNRIFIVVSVTAFIFGAIIGFGESNPSKTPNIEDAFSKFNWDNQTIKKYYEVAQESFEDFKNSKKKKEERSLSLHLFDYPQWESGQYILSDFNKNPPKFVEPFFRQAFPDILQPLTKPKQIIVLYTLITGIVFFSFCYGGLHLILFTIFWVIAGFKSKN